jgi:hypothetical protein
MNKESLIKGNSEMKKDDTMLLRERFIESYSKEKGWNPTELSTNQMLEIISQKEYKSPGLLLG